jgi:uncharacterized membrane protein YbhN (UPF0104 family)
MKKIISYILFLVIGLALLWYASKDVDTKQITDSLGDAHWGWIFLSMCFSYLAMILRGLRWNIILEPIGYRSDKWTNIHSVAFGYLMNNLIPRSGEVARCGLLNRAEHIPVDKLVGTVILERVVDVIILIMVISLTGLIHAEALGNLFDMIPGGKGQTLAIMAFLGIAGVLVLYFALKKLSHISFIGKIAGFLEGIGKGLRAIFVLRQRFLFIILSLGIWVCWLMMSQCMMYALPITENMTMSDTLFFMVGGSLGMLIPTQGGIGAYHFMSKISFEVLGYSGAVGLTFAWISWVGKTILEIAVGAVGFVIVTSRKIKPAPTQA